MSATRIHRGLKPVEDKLGAIVEAAEHLAATICSVKRIRGVDYDAEHEAAAKTATEARLDLYRLAAELCEMTGLNYASMTAAVEAAGEARNVAREETK